MYINSKTRKISTGRPRFLCLILEPRIEFFFFFWQNEIAWILDNFRIITVNDNMFSAENAC